MPQNKEHEAKEELKRRAKQLELQRREMTRRGQDPYATNSNTSFPNQNSNYVPQQSYNDPPRGYPGQSEPAPAAKPFKGKGMQLGAKGKKNENGLAEALGGLSVDEPLLRQSSYSQPAEQEYTPVASPAPPAAPTPTKDVNPFGEVPEAG